MLRLTGYDCFGPVFLFRAGGRTLRRIFFLGGGFCDYVWVQSPPAYHYYGIKPMTKLANEYKTPTVKPTTVQPATVQPATVQPTTVQTSTKQEVKTSTSSTVDTWGPSISGSSKPNYGSIWNWAVFPPGGVV